MIEQQKAELESILQESLKAETRKGQVIGKRDQITSVASGQLRLYPSTVKKFSLILAKPKVLVGFDWNEIRCCICDRVISFNHTPAWYYSIRYAVNHFHYFVCSDKQSLEEQKPSTRCYRRE